jgi:hypothetical protein
VSGWQPSDDFFIRFDDKTGESRSKEFISEMVDRMTDIANEYDFDLSCFGPWFSAVKSLPPEIDPGDPDANIYRHPPIGPGGVWIRDGDEEFWVCKRALECIRELLRQNRKLRDTIEHGEQK